MNSQELKTSIEPAFSAPATCVVFSADANYVPYLAAALASLIHHSSPENLYDIVVLSSHIPIDDQQKISGLTNEAPNFSVRFFDIQEKVNSLSGGFFVNAHISAATYYRLFAPSIFEKYDKILYLDGDIIVLADVADLYAIDLSEQSIGAARDFFAVRDLPRRSSARWANQLQIKNPASYFNAGVLLLNLRRLRDHRYEEKWFDRLKTIKMPKLHDQDILNHTLEGDVKYIDAAWNSMIWAESLGERIEPGDLPDPFYTDFLNSKESPKIIHYLSRNKPWDLPHLKLADLFWDYARQTPYYDRLIFNVIQKISAESNLFKSRLRIPPSIFKYWFYTLMSRLTTGEAKAGYKSRAFRIKAMNARLKTVLKSWH